MKDRPRQQLCIRLDADQIDIIEDLSEILSVSRSVVVRQLITRGLRNVNVGRGAMTFRKASARAIRDNITG